MIQAVIFDCFGVLATDGWLPFRDKHFQDTPDLLEEARVWSAQVDRGQISYSDFITWLSQTTGVSTEEISQVITGNLPNQPLFDYIKESISPTHKVGLLSNVGTNWIDDLFEPWQKGLFDAMLLSCEIGAVKPDPIMYETIAYRLGVSPDQAIFIDDRPEFVAGAEAIGMHGIEYRDLEQMKGELEAMLHA